MAGAGMRGKIAVKAADGVVHASNEMLHAAAVAGAKVTAAGRTEAAAVQAMRAAASKAAPSAAHASPPVPVRSTAMGASSAARFAKVKADSEAAAKVKADAETAAGRAKMRSGASAQFDKARREAEAAKDEARSKAHKESEALTRKAEQEARVTSRAAPLKPAGERPPLMEAVESFRSKAEVMMRADPTYSKYTLGVGHGERWIRLYRNEEGSKRGGAVWGLIDSHNGNIHKSEGYNRPAPQVRGNIYGESPLSGMAPHGPAYLNRSAPTGIQAVKGGTKAATGGGKRAVDGPGEVTVNLSSGPKAIPTLARSGDLFAYKTGKEYKIANTAGKIGQSFGTQKQAVDFLAGAGSGRTMARAMSAEQTPARLRARKAVERYSNMLDNKTKTAQAAKASSKSAVVAAGKLPKVGGPETFTMPNIYRQSTTVRSEASLTAANGTKLHLVKGRTSDDSGYKVFREDGTRVGATFGNKSRALEFMQGAASGKTAARYDRSANAYSSRGSRESRAVDRYRKILDKRASQSSAAKVAAKAPTQAHADLLKRAGDIGATVRGGLVTLRPGGRNIATHNAWVTSAREAGIQLQKMPSGRYLATYKVF